MNELKYPHLFLFTYHFNHQPNLDNHPQKGETYFWIQLPLSDVKADLYCYSIASSESATPQPISCFRDFQKNINSKFHPTTELTKTWMLIGYLPENIEPKDTTILAKNIYESFSGEKCPQNPTPGEFMGGKIFEIWQPTQNWQDLTTEKNSRIVIIIFPNQTTLEKINKFYEDWVNLFYYRNKILWAYSNTLQLNLPANFFPSSSQTLSVNHHIDKNLENLKIELSQNLQTLSKFIADQTYLEIQQQTIKINLFNYKERLNSIEIKARNEEQLNTELICLNDFSQIAQEKYQIQVEKDIDVLTSRVKVWNTWIDNLRAMVASKQIQSDRDLQLEIATFGIAIGVTSATASVISPLIEVITPFPAKKLEEGKEIMIPSNAVFNFGLSLIISIIMGIICGYFGGRLWWRWRSRY